MEPTKPPPMIKLVKEGEEKNTVNSENKCVLSIIPESQCLYTLCGECTARLVCGLAPGD